MFHYQIDLLRFQFHFRYAYIRPENAEYTRRPQSFRGYNAEFRFSSQFRIDPSYCFGKFRFSQPPVPSDLPVGHGISMNAVEGGDNSARHPQNLQKHHNAHRHPLPVKESIPQKPAYFRIDIENRNIARHRRIRQDKQAQRHNHHASEQEPYIQPQNSVVIPEYDFQQNHGSPCQNHHIHQL